MNDSEFHRLADQLWLTIEERLDDWDGDSDIDCEINGGVLTITFENGSKIIINRQTAGQRLFSDAVRQNVEHTEPYILPANCPALYSSSEAAQAFDAIFCQRKRFICGVCGGFLRQRKIKSR